MVSEYKQKEATMTLTCSCDWYPDWYPGDWLYDWKKPESVDFEPLQTRRRVRCCSCRDMIDIEALCIRHRRHRYPWDEIESQIKCGCDLDDVFCDHPPISMANHYQCERCGEIWLNLQSLGFKCLSPNENMADALAAYHDLTGWKQGATP